MSLSICYKLNSWPGLETLQYSQRSLCNARISLVWRNTFAALEYDKERIEEIPEKFVIRDEDTVILTYLKSGKDFQWEWYWLIWGSLGLWSSLIWEVIRFLYLSYVFNALWICRAICENISSGRKTSNKAYVDRGAAKAISMNALADPLSNESIS